MDIIKFVELPEGATVVWKNGEEFGERYVRDYIIANIDNAELLARIPVNKIVQNGDTIEVKFSLKDMVFTNA